MKARNIILELFFIISLCHDCFSKSFYVDYYEEYPDRYPSGQKTLGELLLEGPHGDEQENTITSHDLPASSLGKSPSSASDLLLPLWQSPSSSSGLLTPEELSRISEEQEEGKLEKRNNNNNNRGWGNNPSSILRAPKQTRRLPQSASLFRQNRNDGGYMKRHHHILYRHCFFNPISCFHK